MIILFQKFKNPKTYIQLLFSNKWQQYANLELNNQRLHDIGKIHGGKNILPKNKQNLLSTQCNNLDNNFQNERTLVCLFNRLSQCTSISQGQHFVSWERY